MVSQAMNTEVQTMVVASSHVNDVASQVQQLLSALAGRVSSMDGAWQGSAKVAFDQLMVRWNDSARRLNESLTAISENIRKNSISYESASDDHTAAFRALNI